MPRRTYSIISEQLHTLIYFTVLVFIPNQQTIIFPYPTTVFRKTVSVVIEVNATFSRNRFNSVAIKIEYKRAARVLSLLKRLLYFGLHILADFFKVWQAE
ncbi:hypothetical protein A584_11667 [Pseudomonas syringae pv. theae ICMP 3923]|nr:hypothetical protein A584_11667 [Pseudomonas syringae pv. theae ICMP 3923]